MDPEEQERLEREKAEQQHEADRIHDLREYCARKGLDFDTENRKYLEKKARKAGKAGLFCMAPRKSVIQRALRVLLRERPLPSAWCRPSSGRPRSWRTSLTATRQLS